MSTSEDSQRPSDRMAGDPVNQAISALRAMRMPQRWLPVLLSFVVLACVPIGWWLTRLPAQSLAAGTIELSAGMTMQQLGAQLREHHGLTTPMWMLRWYARLIGAAERLRAGEYRVAAGETLGHLIARIVRGDVVQRRVTLIEGWTFDRALAELQHAPKLKVELAGLSEADVRARLGVTQPHLEGMFLPDTYVYVAGMSDAQVLRLASQRLASTLAREWETRASGLPYADPYAALIVASLVEKETGHAADRDAIAAVFAERLRRGMKLQTDPSVIYGMGRKFDGNLTRADLARDDPYNTYMHVGLPPSPIALAGLAAIRATLHPRESNDLYFVARGDGSSEFSSTLAAHEQAVTRFQRTRGTRVNALRSLPLSDAGAAAR